MEDFDIREARPSDTTAIMDLLQACMGENLHLQTSSDWKWKHRDNPFGPSEILLAEQRGQLVGLRAFMQWTWQCGEKRYNALRAVDTATNPEYRRRGIFKTLTRELVERCRDKGYDFIFNNPNENSRPGYLKMGWKKWGIPPVSLQNIRPVRMIMSLLTTGQNTVIHEEHQLKMDALNNWASWGAVKAPEGLTTPFDLDYVRWRYFDCPVYTYGMKTHPDSIIIFRIQKTRFGTCMRVCDWKWTTRATPDLLMDEWKSLIGSYTVSVAILPWYEEEPIRSLYSEYWHRKDRSFNPLVIFNTLNVSGQHVQEIDQWDLSPGILELF